MAPGGRGPPGGPPPGADEAVVLLPWCGPVGIGPEEFGGPPTAGDMEREEDEPVGEGVGRMLFGKLLLLFAADTGGVFK